MSRLFPTTPSTPAPPPGVPDGGVPHVLNGRYEVGPLIAGGGMAQVYRGHDRLLDRPVAIKVLRQHYAASPELRDRFRREARLAASLTHVHLVNVYDVGQDGERYFIVMELLPGRTLKDLVGSQPLSLPAAIGYARQVAQGMAYAHRRGLVHRDLKPQNVLITEDGQAKVADFGLAMRGETTQLTQPGTVWGTVQYLSPEQAQGLPAGPRSDVYALGAIFYELLTGHPPFDADTPAAVMMKHVYDPPPSVRELDPRTTAAVDAVVQRALAKSPDERFPSMDAFAEALAALLDRASGQTAARSAVAGPDDLTAVLAHPGPGPGPNGARGGRPGGRGGTPDDPTVALRRPGVPGAPGAGGATPTIPLRPGAPPGVRPPAPPPRTDFVPTRPPATGRRRLPVYVAAAVLTLFALMAVGAAVASQAVELGLVAPPATPTPLPPTPTPLPTQTPVPTATATATPIPTVAVPSLVGERQERAVERLQQAGLVPGEVTEVFDQRVPAGSIVSQEPAPNETLEVGKGVKLAVSKGPRQVPVPNTIGKRIEVAEKEVTDAGFLARRIDEFNDQAVAGVVFGQQPRSGVQASVGSEVQLRVSRGRQQVIVPVVRGRPEAEARKAMEDAGLKVVVRYEPYSQIETGQVFAVVPPEGSAVDPGAEVTLRVRRDPTATPAQAGPTPPRPGNSPTPGNAQTPAPNRTPAPAPTATRSG